MSSEPLVRIPPSQHGLFRLVADLEPDVFDGLTEALEGQPNILNRVDLVQAAGPAWPFESPSVAQLLDGLLGLSAAIQIQRWSVSDTAAAAARQVVASDADSPPLMEGLIKERLSALLDGRNVRLSAKALSLAREVPNELQTARVITDLRPVFDREDDTSAGPVGMMVLTTLRLDYFNETGGGAILVTLNDDEVRRLQEDLQWASQKADGLRKLVGQFNLPLHRREEEA